MNDYQHHFQVLFEVSYTMVILGIWDHDIAKYRGPYSYQPCETPRDIEPLQCTGTLKLETRKHAGRAGKSAGAGECHGRGSQETP